MAKFQTIESNKAFGKEISIVTSDEEKDRLYALVREAQLRSIAPFALKAAVRRRRWASSRSISSPTSNPPKPSLQPKKRAPKQEGDGPKKKRAKKNDSEAPANSTDNLRRIIAEQNARLGSSASAAASGDSTEEEE